MTFADYLQLLRRRWQTLVICVCLGTIAAGVVSLVAPVRYTATSTLFVSVAVDPASGDNFQNSQFALQRVKSYSELTASPDVLDPVIDDLDLDETPAELRRRIEVTSPPETVLMEISVTDSEARRSAQIADAVATQLGETIETLETPQGALNPGVTVNLTQPAEVPLSPSEPRVLLNLILGLVAGLALGVVAALVRHAMDRRLKTADDVRDITGVLPLGVILASEDGPDRPLVSADRHSLAAERYRTVRSALKFSTLDRPLRHLLVTSPGPGEGKTTVSANIALSWAQTGARVCLVEADLRRGGVSQLLGIEGNAGLSDVIVGDADLDDVLVSWGDDVLSVLPAGSMPHDPAAVLGSEAVRQLVERLGERFDIVVYDTAPLLLVADAVALGQWVDGVVLVVRSGSTTRDKVVEGLEILDRSRLPLLGSVLNGLRLGRRASEQQYYRPLLTPEDRSAPPASPAELAAARAAEAAETHGEPEPSESPADVPADVPADEPVDDGAGHADAPQENDAPQEKAAETSAAKSAGTSAGKSAGKQATDQGAAKPADPDPDSDPASDPDSDQGAQDTKDAGSDVDDAGEPAGVGASSRPDAPAADRPRPVPSKSSQARPQGRNQGRGQGGQGGRGQNRNRSPRRG